MSRSLLVTTRRLVAMYDFAPGDGAAAARELDVALMALGHKMSGPLLAHLAGLERNAVLKAGMDLLDTVASTVGAHVRHNPYFKGFPGNVPTTQEFWWGVVSRQLTRWGGEIYGAHNHSYEEMAALHERLTPQLKQHFTMLELGGPLDAELYALYSRLALTTVPLSVDDMATLASLAHDYVHRDLDFKQVKNREARAVLNSARLDADLQLRVDTVTDVLRLAAYRSRGDVSLVKRTRFRSFPRKVRRTLLQAMADVLTVPAKAADVLRHPEQWKRLGERLHPHECPHPAVRQAFALARGEGGNPSVMAVFERAADTGDPALMVEALAPYPGILLRNLDRILRPMTGPEEFDVVAAEAVARAAATASGRVVLGLREHLGNRRVATGSRFAVNKAGKGWAMPDERTPLKGLLVDRVTEVLDRALARRLPAVNTLIVEPEMMGLALPLSEKKKPRGHGVLPRGSVVDVTGPVVRLFMYWRQSSERTDYDLSAHMLGAGYEPLGHCDFTRLRERGFTHSGDYTSAPAPDGASEFIDVILADVPPAVHYIVPQVNMFSGESLDQVEEAFFGYMERDIDRKGLPFEPLTVRAKSGLTGEGKQVLPLILMRRPNGAWAIKWAHLYPTGHASFNTASNSKFSTSTLVRGVVEREYLQLGYLKNLMSEGNPAGADLAFARNAVAGRRTYTPMNLADLIPE